MVKNKIDSKTIGTFVVNFKTHFDLKSDDFIYLDIDMTEDLKELLQSVCLMEDTLGSFTRYDNQRKRYKVKSWLYNSVYSEEREFLFEKELLDNGKVTLKFTNTDAILKVVRGFKEGIKNVIDNIMRYRDYEVNVKYIVSDK